MTKKLEELLNMSSIDDGSTDNLPEEIEPAQAIEVVSRVEKSLRDVDDIETALAKNGRITTAKEGT